MAIAEPDRKEARPATLLAWAFADPRREKRLARSAMLIFSVLSILLALGALAVGLWFRAMGATG